MLIPNNETPDICSACGGACCKRSAGIYHPDEVFYLTEQEILKRMYDKKWAIDCWEGDPRLDHDDYSRVYFIRPRHTNANDIDDYSWGGECVFLTKTGCSLTFEDRPIQCRALEPTGDSNMCDFGKREGCEKQNLSVAYIPYQDIIYKLFDVINCAIEA